MMEVRPNQSSDVPLPEQQLPARANTAAGGSVGSPPVWAQRLLLGTEAAIAVWAGILVFLIPWTHLWTANSLLARWPTLHFLFTHPFVRGMISGIGLVDIWMGVCDALSLRKKG